MIGNRTHTTTRARRNSPRQKSINLNTDVLLLLATFTLLLFGALMVYSASWDFSFLIYDDASYMFTRQMTWMILGIIGAVITAIFDYHYYRKLAVPAMAVTLLGLITVLILSEVRYGATRTISGGSFMPSELAKLVTIIYLSVWLYSKRNQLHDMSMGMVPLGGILGIVSGLILMQPDLSAAFTIFFLGGMLFFLAGADLKQIFILLVLAVIVGWVVVQIHPTGSKRIGSFLQTIEDPTQADYHVKRSFEAFIQGGVFGSGIGNSTAKLTGLPVPPTDSIFAVVAEETGLFGTTLLIGLYCVIVWRGMHIANHAPDALGSLLAAGLTLWLGLEAFINMAVMIGLLPFAGNALPFVSAGGSSLLVSLAAIGILMNIARMSNPSSHSSKRNVNASNDLRRRHRRGRVSSYGNSPSTR